MGYEEYPINQPFDIINRCAYHGHPPCAPEECAPVRLVNCGKHGRTEVDTDMDICGICVDEYYEGTL